MSTREGTLHDVEVIKNLFVPMRDGTRLAVDLIRPAESKERFPALIETYPYRKDDYTSLADADMRRSKYYLAQRGYVVVRADVRGTGGSEGANTHMYEPEEMTDGYDLVEWAAKQPWCTGSVGQFGSSYGGVNSYQIAMHQPPSLKAIVSMLGTDEVYADTFYPGGALRGLFELGDYGPGMISMTFSPPDPDYSGDEWAKIWDYRLNHNRPWILGWLEHQRDSEYWRAKSVNPDFSRIKVPTFIIAGWNDRYNTSSCRVFSMLKVPKKLLIGPWQHDFPNSGLPGPRVDHLREIGRWFDHWLKGSDTGITREPPMTVFVRRYDPPAGRYDKLSGFWRHEEQWPPTRVANTTLFLAQNGRLSESVPADGSDVYRYNPSVGLTAGFMGGLIGQGYGMALDQRTDEALSLVYDSTTLADDTEVLGPVQAVLHLSTTAPIAHVAVKVCDVAPDGSSLLVTRGLLNLTHRASHSNPTKLEPGKPYEVVVATDPVAYVFPAGHRVRLDISGSDFPNVWPSPEPCVSELTYGAAHPSRILLPVAPAQDPALPVPALVPVDIEVPELPEAQRPRYLVQSDIPRQRVSVSMGSSSQVPVSSRTKLESNRRFEFSVSLLDPGEATVSGEATVTITKPGIAVATTGTCLTRSTRDTFHVTATVNVTLNGSPYFSKRWNLSLPRDHV